jgi:hypothetical protein
VSDSTSPENDLYERTASCHFRPEGAEGPSAIAARSRIEWLLNASRRAGLVSDGAFMPKDVDVSETPIDCFSDSETQVIVKQ